MLTLFAIAAIVLAIVAIVTATRPMLLKRSIIAILLLTFAFSAFMVHTKVRTYMMTNDQFKVIEEITTNITSYEMTENELKITYQDGTQDIIVKENGKNYRYDFEVIDGKINSPKLIKIYSRTSLEDCPLWVQILILPYERVDTWKWELHI